MHTIGIIYLILSGLNFVCFFIAAPGLDNKFLNASGLFGIAGVIALRGF